MKKTLFIIGALALPAIVSAQETLTDTLDTVEKLLNQVIPIVITLAVIFFFYGVAKYVMAAGDEEAQKQGRSIMIYGIIGLAVIVGVWGFVALITGTFAGGGGAKPDFDLL